MPRVKRVKARKRWRDCQTGKPIEVGTVHYTWKCYRAPRQRSVARPRRSMLTSSQSLALVYDAEDELGQVSEVQDAYPVLEQLEEARELCEEQAANIEEYFTDSEVGNQLLEWAYALDLAVSELEALIAANDLTGIQATVLDVE